MFQARRLFLGTAASFVAAAALGQVGMPPPQQRRSGGTPPFGDPGLASPDLQKPNSRTLKANQAAIGKDMTRLEELVAELRDSLDANSSTEVLSLDTIHKTEEIEKLARKIRDLLRG